MLQRFFLKLKKFVNPNMASLIEANTSGKRPADTTEDADCKKHKMEGLPDRKRKVALLIAYNGKGYYGLQVNPGCSTIESEILKALLDVGVIPQGHHDCLQKMSFQRAARTDKGVSAAGNLLSLKMLLNVDNLLDKINEKLPPQIRVFDCIRTTNGFNCKNHCSGRTYLYILPTYALAPVEQACSLDYRINMDILERMNEILEKYIGTHNFHNFTSGVKPHEASAKRYIKQFECRLPFVRDGVEFCVISVKGQSFMLHQIRKMVGLAIAIVKGFTHMETIDLAFQHEKVDVPLAPALGLLLEKLHYDQYNMKWASDGSHAKLDFNHLKDKLEPFKDKFIISSIVKEEIETQSMMQWLPVLHKHTYDTESNYDGRRFPSLNPRKRKNLDASGSESESTADITEPATQEEHSNSDKTGSQPVVEESGTGTSMCSDSTNQNELKTESSQADCDNSNVAKNTASSESEDKQSEQQCKTASTSS